MMKNKSRDFGHVTAASRIDWVISLCGPEDGIQSKNCNDLKWMRYFGSKLCFYIHIWSVFPVLRSCAEGRKFLLQDTPARLSDTGSEPVVVQYANHTSKPSQNSSNAWVKQIFLCRPPQDLCFVWYLFILCGSFICSLVLYLEWDCAVTDTHLRCFCCRCCGSWHILQAGWSFFSS